MTGEVTAWVVFGVVLVAFLGLGFYMRPRRPKPPKAQHTAYLVAKVKQIPEYPYFAVEQIGTFSSPCPAMKLSLIPVTVLETDGDNYGEALKYLAMEMKARGIPDKVIEEVVG